MERHRPQSEENKPEILASNREFKALADELLQGSYKGAYAEFRTTIDPEAVKQSLIRSPLDDLLVKPGDSFAESQPNAYQHRLFLFDTTKYDVKKVSLRARGHNYHDLRRDPSAPMYYPPKLIESSGEYWERMISIELLYKENQASPGADQFLHVHIDSLNTNKLPIITRDVGGYLGMGNDITDEKSRPFRDQEEMLFFVSLARDIFNNKI